jgi:hypothetical protein
MKAVFLLPLTLCLALSVRAQIPGASYSPEQLDQMLGPIALYPDPLVALILPASTAPSDLVLAARYLAANGAPAGIDAQPWDPSVKALARYPEVVQWMNANLEWTQALGAAFAQQPTDVMKSIQQLRAEARAAGTLVDTPQQRIDMAGDDIRIVPAQPDTIYVPEYDPMIVYETPVGYSGPFITFGVGFPVGAWLSYQCDWDDFGIWIGPWNRGWDYRREWRRPGFGGNHWQAWRPDPRRSREMVHSFYRPEGRLPSPGFIPGYRAPVRRPGEAPHVAMPRATFRPDYRGRVIEAPRPAGPAPSSPLFGGYNRGTQTRDFSNRGQASRSAPVRIEPPPRAAPSGRGEAPAHAAPPTREAAPGRGAPPPPPAGAHDSAREPDQQAPAGNRDRR